MEKHAFLSETWMTEAAKLRHEYADRIPKIPMPIRANQIITGVPFGTGSIEAHLETVDGLLDLDLGLLENPDATVTLDYDIARKLIVDGDFQAVMGAFMAGKVKIQGDMMKLMGLVNQPAVNTPAASEVAELQQRLRDITE